MKTSSFLKAIGLTVAFSAATFADDLTWTSEFSGSPLKWLYINGGSSSYYQNTFNIMPGGFDPLSMTITSAIASFAFADDGDSDEEWVDITLAGNLFINEEVDGSHPSSSYAWYSDNLNVALIADLQADGKLDFKVQLLNTPGINDVYLKVAKLVAKGHTTTTTVPDSSTTLVLLGAALAGLFSSQKRFARRA